MTLQYILTGTLKLYIAADDRIDELYVDGVKTTVSPGDQDTVQQIEISANASVIAVKASDVYGGVAGLLACVFGDNLRVCTDTSWKCATQVEGDSWTKTTFDDSSWPSAVAWTENKASGLKGTRAGIPDSASWIWTNNYKDANIDKTVCFRLQLRTLKLYIAADDRIDELYVDGVKTTVSPGDQDTVQQIKISANASVIAVKASDVYGGVAGLLACVLGDNLRVCTDTSWKCATQVEGDSWTKTTFDDSSWPSAVAWTENKASGLKGTRAGIPDSASWIWTNNYKDANIDKTVCFRLQLRTLKLYIAADDRIDELYVDGVKTTVSPGDQDTVQQIKISANASVIAVKASDVYGGVAGLLACVLGDNLRVCTDTSWKCATQVEGDSWTKTTFDDSSWPSAVAWTENKASGLKGTRAGIPDSVSWIWTNNYKDANIDKTVCFRLQLPKKEKPIIVMKLNEVEATARENVRLVSTVTGEPEPIVEWLKDDVKLTTSGRTTMKRNGNEYSLVIDQIVQQEEGQYIVRATNSEGTTQAVATLRVKVAMPTVPTLTHVIPKGSSNVAGVTSLNNQLYVVRYSAQQQIEVYDSATFTLQRNISVPGLSASRGLTSCAVNNCLYVTECDSNLVFRVALQSSGDTVTQWSVGKCPFGISVNSASNVLVTCYNEHKLQEYTTHGSLIRDISLSSAGVTNPRCSIQLPNGQIAISYGHGVLVVDNNGAMIRNHTNTTGPSIQFSTPLGFASVQNGCTLLANHGTHQVLLFNPSFSSTRVLSLPSNSALQGPFALFLDESRGRLYIGEWDGCRVLVFDNVFNVGNDFQ